MDDGSEHFDPDAVMNQIAGQASSLFGQIGAMVAESASPVRLAYELCPWERVNELAAQGWQLQGAAPLVPGFTHGLAFIMYRVLSPADEAAELLEQVTARD